MKNLIRALLVLCAAFSALADPYHPQIVKSQVVTLDAAAIERDANSGTPFELALGDTHLKVVLNPAPVWPEEGLRVLEVDKDGSVKEHVVVGNVTYAGDVLDEDPETSELRFAIARGAMEGYVLSKTGWWFIEPATRFDPKASADQYLVYATRDLDFALEYADDVQTDTVYDDTRAARDPRVAVAMIADLPYVNRSGDSFTYYERQAALLNAVNGIYIRQIGREFRMQLSAADFAGTFLSSSDPRLLLGQLGGFVSLFGGLKGLFSDIAHLTTGRNLDGDVLGIAWEPGVTGLTQQGIVRAGTGWPSSYAPMLAYQNMMVAAHEIGHNFNGDHGEADRWCVTEFITCLDYERSIMWPAFYPDNENRFSDGTRNPNHNNAERIRSNMNTRYPQ